MLNLIDASPGRSLLQMQDTTTENKRQAATALCNSYCLRFGAGTQSIIIVTQATDALKL
jgi:hypothetical protein